MDDVTTVYKSQFLDDDKYYSMFQTFKNHVNDKGPELLVEAISKMNIKEKSLKVSTERARILKKTISLVIMHHHTMYGIHPVWFVMILKFTNFLLVLYDLEYNHTCIRVEIQGG